MATDDTTGLTVGSASGPYDIGALDTPVEDLGNSHLDLGSVLVPVVEGGQVTVEMSPDHQPAGVYLLTEHGRIGVSAFAAPKAAGLWREVVTELAASLRDEGATTSIEDGHWGREVVARVPGAVHRFIGVDGPRWMARCVASGPDETSDELGQLARAVLAETVVRRGNEPVPPRDALPIVLPPVLAEQVTAAQQQMVVDQELDPEQLAQLQQQLAEQQAAFDQAAAAPAEEDRAGIDTGESVPGGARDQIASATVFSDQPVAEEPVEPEDDPMPPSQGSAMQRFRRRRRS